MFLFSLIVFSENIIGHFISVFPGKVNVKIGRIFPVEIDKSLEIQVQFDGVHISNPQAIGDDAIGTGSTAHMVEVALLRKGHDVVIDQEVGGKGLLLDEF